MKTASIIVLELSEDDKKLRKEAGHVKNEAVFWLTSNINIDLKVAEEKGK